MPRRRRHGEPVSRSEGVNFIGHWTGMTAVNWKGKAILSTEYFLRFMIISEPEISAKEAHEVRDYSPSLILSRILA